MPAALSLVSWNLHGIPFLSTRRERLRRVAARVLDAEPDVVLFQEVWLHRDAAQLMQALAALYEPVPGPSSLRPMRMSGLLSLIRRDKGWAVRRWGFHGFTHNAPRWKIWEGDGLGRKGVQEILLEGGDMNVHLLNTHLQASYPWNGYEPIRRPQLVQLCELTTHLDWRWPVIAGGDLNTRPSESLYDDLLAHWCDLTIGKREQGGLVTHLHRDGGEGDWIDYILARRHD